MTPSADIAILNDDVVGAGQNPDPMYAGIFKNQAPDNDMGCADLQAVIGLVVYIDDRLRLFRMRIQAIGLGSTGFMDVYRLSGCA